MNIEQIAQEVMREMADAILPQVVGAYEEAFLRRCLSKLAEQAEEPVAYQSTRNGFIAKEDKNPEYNIPLYTETQLIAAQQKASEACAKAVFEQAKYFGYNVHAEAVRDAALNNWRKYL